MCLTKGCERNPGEKGKWQQTATDLSSVTVTEWHTNHISALLDSVVNEDFGPYRLSKWYSTGFLKRVKYDFFEQSLMLEHARCKV